MFVIIPEPILQSIKLTSDEKIIISMISTLEKFGKKFFASELYLLTNLGMENGKDILYSLVQKGFLSQCGNDYQLLPHVKQRLGI